MNQTPITFTGNPSLQDVLDLVRYRSLCQVRPAIRWLIGVLSFLIAASIVLVWYLGHFTATIPLILVLCAYFPIGWWYHAFWVARRHYRKQPEIYVNNTVTIDKASVSISSVGMELRLAWKHIDFLLDTPEGLMFVLPNVRVLCWLPQRLFQGNDHKAAILTYATGNNIPVRSMK